MNECDIAINFYTSSSDSLQNLEILMGKSVESSFLCIISLKLIPVPALLNCCTSIFAMK